MEKELAYWKKRCELAEEFIEESPCDPDITSEQIKAYDEWQRYVKLENNKDMRKVEWISCLCGAIIAGCVDGEQDEEWARNREMYLRKGYTTQVSSDTTKKFGKCCCKYIVGFVKTNFPDVIDEIIEKQNEQH